MSNHTPTTADNLITCSCCSFRAVCATDGRVLITEVGDTSVDHLASVRQAQAERRAYVALLVERLEAQQRYCIELPRCDGLHVAPCEELKTGRCVCSHQHGYILTYEQLQRLTSYVLKEHGL